MQQLNRDEIVTKINYLAKNSTPFVFIVDFKGEYGYLFEIDELKSCNIAIAIDGKELGREILPYKGDTHLCPTPISKDIYTTSFENVKKHILHGDSYLLNLTFATPIGGNISLENIYSTAKASYKVLFQDKFVFYSPETFVKIEDNKIYSYPMKGTISAEIPDAANHLLNDKKELYEHYTIVDLIRNDLSMVSHGIEVTKFRYIDRIESAKGAIYQTSSEVCGTLEPDWQARLGDIIFKMLPAGSVSGAPKEMTVDIIDSYELLPRGFYTGIMGYFDGERFNSSVNIRFIEHCKESDNYLYRSGGGITHLSNLDEEYNELITKIYVPTF